MKKERKKPRAMAFINLSRIPARKWTAITIPDANFLNALFNHVVDKNGDNIISPAGVGVDTTNSPNVYFTIECAG